MDISIIVFDEFTDIDVFLPWDLLNRVKSDDTWNVRLLGDQKEHRSKAGLVIPMHGPVESANAADVVLFSSGPATRRLCRDQDYLRRFSLNAERQLIASMCSGALILAGLGLLDGIDATTYPTAVAELESFGVRVVRRPFVQAGNIATAAGCLAALDLVGWVIETKLGPSARDRVLQSVSPVGCEPV